MGVIKIENPNQVFQNGRQISLTTDDLREQLSKARNVRDTLKPSWTGTDSERYINDLNAVINYLNNTIALLDNYGTIVRNSMSRYANISEN